MELLLFQTGSYHISNYDKYDALVSRVTSTLRTFDPPSNASETDYDVRDENDHLDYARGSDGNVRACFLGQHSVKGIHIVKTTHNALQPGWFESKELAVT